MAMGFGIVGCGMISNFHAKAIADVEGAELVACFDMVKEAADRLARETGCKAYYSLDEMLADPKVEIVTIGTPSGAHMDPAVAAARAGKHVIVENRWRSRSQVRSDHRRVHRGGRGLLDDFPSRFHDSSQTIRKAVDAGRFGKLTVGDAYVSGTARSNTTTAAWRGTWGARRRRGAR